MEPVNEFELIRRYFRRHTDAPASVVVGVGDDAAVIAHTPGCETVVSVDSVIAGRHVPLICSGEGFAQRLLARGVSDLAAMGATPRYLLLSLTLPNFDSGWVDPFAERFHQLAVQWGLHLIGGDTTRGPLSAQVTVIGELPAGSALRRGGARAGDVVWMVGEPLGGARAYLDVLDGSVPDHPVWSARYWHPNPLIAEGQALREQATACIDVSDGLCQDLMHVLEAAFEPLVAELYTDAVPIAADVIDVFGAKRALEYALTGGDEYCLLCTLPAGVTPSVPAEAIGELVTAETAGLQLDGEALPSDWQLGWDHSR